MSTGFEVPLAFEAVETICTTSPAITAEVADRVYLDVAPVDIEYPFIVYSESTSDDVQGVGPNRIWTNVDVLIKGYVGTDDLSVARPLAIAIDAAFTTATVTTTGGVVISATRLRPYSEREEYESGPVRAIGGIYRIHSQSS